MHQLFKSSYVLFIFLCVPLEAFIISPYVLVLQSSSQGRERTLVSPSTPPTTRTKSTPSFSNRSKSHDGITTPIAFKRILMFRVHYQNYQQDDVQPLVVVNKDKILPKNNNDTAFLTDDIIPPWDPAAIPASSSRLLSSSIMPYKVDGLLNDIEIPTNIRLIDLPRAAFEKKLLQELFESNNSGEPESWMDIEILSGRVAIVLSLYLYSTEILTGEGVLDQVSHWFS